MNSINEMHRLSLIMVSIEENASLHTSDKTAGRNV